MHQMRQRVGNVHATDTKAGARDWKRIDVKKEKVKKYTVRYYCKKCNRITRRKFSEAPFGRVIMPPEETKCGKCNGIAKIARFE